MRTTSALLKFKKIYFNAIAMPMILIGYKMAKLLSDKTIENLSIKDKAISIVNEWNFAMSELIAVMLESKEFKED